MRKYLFPCLLLLFFSAASLEAQNRFYFNNQPVKGVTVLSREGTFYLPLNDLSLKLHFNFTAENGGVILNEKKLNDFFTRGGETWVSLDEFASAWGGWYEYDPDLGSIDVYSFTPQAETAPPLSPAPERVEPPPLSNAEGSGKVKPEIPNQKEQPLKVEKSDIFYPNDQTIKCEARVRNTGERGVGNGAITCFFFDSYGRVLGKVEKTVRYLYGGQSDLMTFEIDVQDFYREENSSSATHQDSSRNSSQGLIFPVYCDFKISYK